MDDFQSQLNKFITKAGNTAEKEVQKVAKTGLRGVMRKSPVDEGTFRGNWNIGINSIDSTFQTEFTYQPARYQYDSQNYARGVKKIQSFELGDVINISNSLPYANILEYTNHSKQGNGMVRRTKAELASFLKKQNDKV